MTLYQEYFAEGILDGETPVVAVNPPASGLMRTVRIALWNDDSDSHVVTIERYLPTVNDDLRQNRQDPDLAASRERWPVEVVSLGTTVADKSKTNTIDIKLREGYSCRLYSDAAATDGADSVSSA